MDVDTASMYTVHRDRETQFDCSFTMFDLTPFAVFEALVHHLKYLVHFLLNLMELFFNIMFLDSELRCLFDSIIKLTHCLLLPWSDLRNAVISSQSVNSLDLVQPSPLRKS